MIVSKRLLQQLIDEEFDRTIKARERLDENVDSFDDQDDDEASASGLLS